MSSSIYLLNEAKLPARQLVKSVVVLFLFFIGSLMFKFFLLQGTNTVNLPPAPGISGIISQSLGVKGSTKSLPLADHDYILSNITYFEDNSWVVAQITPKNHNADTATVVINNINPDMPHVVLGPGSAFSSSDLSNLPTSVAQYLTNEGLVYVPAK